MYDPNPFDPSADAYWTDEYEDQFRAAMAGGAPQQFALPGELAKGTQPSPVPPAPPPQRIGPFGVQTPDEVPASAVVQPLSPEEEAQIQIDAPTLTPDEEAQIEIDPRPPTLELAPPPPPMQAAPTGAPWEVGQQLAGMNAVGTVADNSRAPVDPYTGINSPDPNEASDAWVKLAQENPDEYIKQSAHAQDIIDSKRLAETARIAREDADREVANAQAHAQAIERAQQAAQQLDADVAELGKQRIDPDRWMHSRHSWQKVTAFVAAIAGGLAQSATGGRNTGLDIINKAIDDDVAAQAANLQNSRNVLETRRGLVADMYARTGDMYRAQETARIAMREQAIRALEIEMQQYDPKGTAARNLAQVRLQAIADTQKAKQEYAKNKLDYETKEADLQLKQLDAKLKQQKLDKAGAGAGVKYKPEYFSAQGLPPPPFPMSEKEYDKFLNRLKDTKTLAADPTGKSEAQKRKDEADAQKAEAEAAAAKSGYAIKNPETGHVITNPDGSPVLEMDATKRNRVSGIIEAATNIRRLADRMKALKEKDGGAWKVLGSDEAQDLQNLASMLDFETFKAFDLGAPSEGDKALAEGVRGGVDPTSFVKNATAGFQAYADAVEKKANTALRNSGYTGPALHFTRESDAKGAEKDVVDQIGGRLTSSMLREAKKTGNPLDEANQKIAGALYGQINKETNEDLDTLVAYAQVQNDMGERARAYLRELATKAVYPEVKARAKALLDQLPGAHQRGDEAR